MKLKLDKKQQDRHTKEKFDVLSIVQVTLLFSKLFT